MSSLDYGGSAGVLHLPEEVISGQEYACTKTLKEVTIIDTGVKWPLSFAFTAIF